MGKKRINVKDVVNQEFYQLPKVFIWDEKYRKGLSDGAKLLYMILRDRFNLSIHTTNQDIQNGSDSPTYIDEEGNIYCILDNVEIAFTLNKSVKTVIGLMEELIELELVDKADGGAGKANRIYMNILDSSGSSLATFLGEKDYYKHVHSCKKKKKQPSKTLEECIAMQLKKHDKKEDNNTDSTGGCKSYTPGDVKTTPLGGNETTPRGDVSSTPLGVKDLHPNKNDLKELKSKENYVSNNDLSNSSSKEKEDKPLEEEQQVPVEFSVYDNYALLEAIKPLHDICPDKKAFNVVRKTLTEAKVESFFKCDVLNAIGSHPRNMKQYQNKGEQIKYEPAFFANNLVDRIRSNQADRKVKAESEKKMEQPKTFGNIPILDIFDN